jgi:ATP-dependent Clp protease, protease subunit
VELGFADAILFSGESERTPASEGVVFSKMAVMNSLLDKLPRKEKKSGTDITALEKRLDLLKL